MIVTVEARLSWWVKPYIALLTTFVWSISWAMDMDDLRLEEFIERQAKFIADHGLKVRAVPFEMDGRA